jgi:carbon storage regulator CsrA
VLRHSFVIRASSFVIPRKETHMLVLTRKKNEQIVITLGTQVVFVRVLEVCRDRVRLGIIAPKAVTIHRDEVARRLVGAAQEPERMLAGAAP